MEQDVRILSSQALAGEAIPVRKKLKRLSLGVYAFHQLQARIRSPKLRRRVASLLARRPGRSTSTLPATTLETLSRDGIYMMPAFLSPEQAAALRGVLARFPCEDPWKPERGQFAHDAAPAGTHVADIPAAPSLTAAHEIAFDPELLAIAEAYLGGTPYVDSVQVWWSLSGNDQPEEAENFHRDNDGIRFLKFFLYLTDVGEGHGPHKFVRGSQVDDSLLDRRRFTDDEVAEAFGADRILTLTGKAGDAFIEDTFGVHKGQLPAEGNRLLLQVRYSLTPTIFRSRVVVDGPVPTGDTKVVSLIHDE